MEYITCDNDMLDAICFRHYGHTHGTVEKTLQHNPGLCELGPVFAAGIKIELPELTDGSIKTQETVRLYD